MILLIILLGLCMGSFINALVWRLHEQAKAKRKPSKDLSILKGRSMCPHCKNTLRFWDLLPVASWLSLGGKCRYCKKPISWQYPLVELLVAVLFVGSYLWWPHGWDGIGIAQYAIWLAIIVVLVALALYDYKWMLLPHKLVWPFTILAVGHLLLLTIGYQDAAAIIAGFWGVVCLSGLFYILFQVSSGKWIGGGDVKLGVGLGIIVGGPVPALLLLFIASLLGTIMALPQLVKNGRKAATSRVPFGPYLIVATLLVYIFGSSIISWYKNLFLLG